MNDTHYVNLTNSGPPETVLPLEDTEAIESLNEALKETTDSSRREALSEVAIRSGLKTYWFGLVSVI